MKREIGTKRLAGAGPVEERGETDATCREAGVSIRHLCDLWASCSRGRVLVVGWFGITHQAAITTYQKLSVGRVMPCRGGLSAIGQAHGGGLAMLKRVVSAV